ncbi:MAG: FAD-dependent oxidoreductase [Bacteroidales bacterium]|nr:FAD-dependent oxidoreductase [Bacteroidales bacterium]MCF8334242.1 FAD-dependent oxidoreductase [Bacteroidales bacterium]
MADRLNVILNGKRVIGYKGETILQLAERNGINIPTLCNDPRLEPYTSCFLCVVDLKNGKGHQPACSTQIAEGMEVETTNEGIRKSRRMALELMLSDHYADCAAPCRQTCPAGVDVQAYISLIDKGQYSEAVKIIKDTNPLPAICGRVCVRPCEDECRRNLLDESAPVGIDYLKRFAADYDLQSENKYVPEVKPSTGKKVAVIGGGPGGLSAAHFLQIQGHQADIYEAAPLAGGWLRYGIPEYRLPNDILDEEIKNITDLGVNLYTNKKLGSNVNYSDLKNAYDATILTIGSQKGTLLGCEGEDAENVVSGIDFLRNMEMTGQKHDFTGKTVAVVGGGNTAMDCCRTAKRCNADNVYVIYRRSEEQMPANPIEIHESKLEGVEYMLLTNPKKVNKDENGRLKSVTLLKMQLGEPDKSGRRRPIPIEGSEFELEVDYILAAIGQKTDVNFIDDINNGAEKGQLELNRWGDIDADPKTLQTGISSVFAAGDGVTGPATIIEAIAQAQVASHSVEQYLNGAQTIDPPQKEFLSRKENFREQKKEEFMGHYPKQEREEMPTLPEDKRLNFKEVELGYRDENVARHEAQRCLECGCIEYYDCELKKYAMEYGAEQKHFDGEYSEHSVDFRHPYIEIDNNKCILCARCIRMCNEVVGADALGFVNRGFKTYVAPAMGDSLQETNCESCGMCIEACPTGAITENVVFKPGPVKTERIKTPDIYGSEGFDIQLRHRNNFFYGAESTTGPLNTGEFISPQAKFGYKYLNATDRLTRPMLKTQEGWKTISFEEAFDRIQQKIKKVESSENAVFAGARLTNEEMYLWQKFTRAALKTNNISSFHYLGRGEGYAGISKDNVPFDQLDQAKKIVVFGTDLAKDHPVMGYMVNEARKKGAKVEYVTNKKEGPMHKKADRVFEVGSYYYLTKALNHYILSSGMENGMFIRDKVGDFEEYKQNLLGQDFDTLYMKGKPCCMDHFADFARTFNESQNTVLIFSEKQVSANTAIELRNLAMITGKLGKTASGIISLKEKNNSHGLFDMGVNSSSSVGNVSVHDENMVSRMKEKWSVSELPSNSSDMLEKLEKKEVKNLFIFGEDPVGCAVDSHKAGALLDSTDFMVVQDYFMTETAQKADLVLPASIHLETGGSFTNTQQHIRTFERMKKPAIEKDNVQQAIALMDAFGVNGVRDEKEARDEAFSLLADYEPSPLRMVQTEEDNQNRMFEYGCDAIHKRIEEEFTEKLK